MIVIECYDGVVFFVLDLEGRGNYFCIYVFFKGKMKVKEVVFLRGKGEGRLFCGCDFVSFVFVELVVLRCLFGVCICSFVRLRF